MMVIIADKNKTQLPTPKHPCILRISEGTDYAVRMKNKKLQQFYAKRDQIPR
jgi:hypothetical protein